MGNGKRNRLAQIACQKAEPSLSLFGQPKHASTQEEVPPAVRCAENVVLLELLDPVPKRPITYAAPRPSRDRHGDVERNLSMGQEGELATNLAFLAGISDNPNYIMAVCIEELPKAQGCRVLIAINKCLPADGDVILSKVQRGFQQIFGRLKEVTSGKNRSYSCETDCTSLTWALICIQETRPAIEEAVFNDIVALCSERILSSLRSKKSNNSSLRYKTRFIGLVLQEFIRSPWEYRVDIRSPQMSVSHLAKYRRRLEKLSAALDDLEAADVVRHEELARLVRHISLLTEEVPLPRLLEGLTNQDMSPTSKDRLLACLSKIKRYWECAPFLCQRAEQLSMLQNVVVQKVQYAAQAEGRPLPSPTTADFEQSLKRIQHRGKPVQIHNLPKWMTKAAMSLQQSFPNDVNKIRTEAKVHAEVQLLAHYENVSHGVIPPRILASSKDACYLCHSLIKLHGKYEVPKSHGRLYKGWCLPAAYQDGPLQRSLNSFLERQISATLQGLMALPRKPLVMFSNESTIFPINLSASTLAGPTSSPRSSALGPGVATLGPASENLHLETTRIDSVEDVINAQSKIASDASVSGSGGEITYGVGDGVDDRQRCRKGLYKRHHWWLLCC